MKKLMLVAVLGSGLLFAGCASFNPFHSISSPPEAPRKLGSWTQDEKITPRVVVPAGGGAPVVVNEIERHYDARAEETAPKLTLGRRIGNFFAGLSFWGIVFVAVSLLCFGGAPIVWVARKYFSMKAALTSTVKAIREIQPEQFEAIKPRLEANQDRADKAVIAKIKAKL